MLNMRDIKDENGAPCADPILSRRAVGMPAVTHWGNGLWMETTT